MKHVIIRNFGPLLEADVQLGRTNLLIGLQSSGKSCVMMVACYCSWVEKRIALRQSPAEFVSNGDFMNQFLSYYHIKGYMHPDTYISYETEYMSFSYDNSKHVFEHTWKGKRYNYRRPKISYVPAERNLISLISNWSSLKTSYDNILDFKSDWDVARSFMNRENNILGLGMSYVYDKQTETDSVITADGHRLSLENTSSGVQSLIPQFVYIDYLCNGIFKAESQKRERTYSEKQNIYNALESYYQKYVVDVVRDDAMMDVRVVQIEGRDYPCHDEKTAKRFEKEVRHLLYTDHAEIFLEEPESNLFPTTQYHLMDWLVSLAENRMHKHFFFIATHSPYVLSKLIRENMKDFKVFLTQKTLEGKYRVYTASDDDVQAIFDNGSDAFFNLDVFN